MTDNQFDNFFREKLKDHSAAVPEGLWEKIRPEKDKKPLGFFLNKKSTKGLMVAALLIGASIVAFDVSRTNKIEEAIHQSADSNNTSINTATPSNNSITPDKNITLEKNSNTARNNNLSNSTNNLTNSTPTQNISETENTVTQKNSGSQFTASSKLAATNKFTTTNIYPENNQLKSSLDENHIETNPPAKADDLDGGFNNNYFPIERRNHYPIVISSSGSKQQTGMVNKQLAADAHDKKFKSIIICPTIRGNSSSFNSDWAMEVFASPDYAFKSITNNTASQQYLDKKDSSEQMQVGFSAGLRLVKPLNDHLLLKTGFQYSQINEKFSYRNENEIKTTTVVTQRTIIRSPGDTIQVSDTSVMQQIGYSVKVSHNRYRSIDIPLTIGYQFGDGDWNFAINGGVIFNIASWYQGEMLDSSYNPITIDKANNPIYKTNIGMGLYSSISINKKISENTHLFFEPYFRYNLQDMTTDQSPYKQRFHIGGLAIGLRFNLNSR